MCIDKLISISLNKYIKRIAHNILFLPYLKIPSKTIKLPMIFLSCISYLSLVLKTLKTDNT